MPGVPELRDEPAKRLGLATFPVRSTALNWRLALTQPRWMYRVILSLDANFRLSNRLTRSSKRTDPNLTEGKAYMVPEDDYMRHIKETEGEEVDVVRAVAAI